ncbi:hypothetical protein CLI64_20850 [Nostoc sp. CENA543]|uniref:DUF1822 family protein n=1 Tax=Nostoc sp. CENA543 TaxID=1869241 RepID=UPI000CA0A81E|nr:DUF1822 family protein [Nostoc sp. CENA543]AUT02645.1 hypothetical protein CLI64_20850 [Nostoc sp. CENA543]
MNNLTNNNSPKRLEFETLPTAAINLNTAQITQAVEISNQINHSSQQWQVYLQALALIAFESWLDERSDSLKINIENCTLLHPGLATAIAAVANLQIGEFKLCLLTTTSLTDNQVILPRAVVDLPEYIAHFYVLLEVLEEQDAVTISSYLTYSELRDNCLKTTLKPTSDWNYHIPINWFVSEPDRLLLYLHCLEPAAITLPQPNNKNTQVLAKIQNELLNLLPQLQSPEIELWQILTWEQGMAVIAHPELLTWVYNLPQKPHHDSSQNSLKDLLKLLTQPALNVGRWLWDELDELAQEFAWQLLPVVTPAAAMRSPTEEFTAIVTQLQQRNIEIPMQARGAYQDFLLTGIPLRLYAVAWHLLSESDPHLWTLLLVLGTASHQTLPVHLKLRVSDQTGVLVEKGINPQQGEAYLFTRVVGNWDEKFLVTVSLIDGVEVNLPPFTFCPQKVI